MKMQRPAIPVISGARIRAEPHGATMPAQVRAMTIAAVLPIAMKFPLKSLIIITMKSSNTTVIKLTSNQASRISL